MKFCAVMCNVQLIVKVRKSGRAPKPTEKLLEGKQQEKMKTVDDEEESVDAIAAGIVIYRHAVVHPHSCPHRRPTVHTLNLTLINTVLNRIREV